MKNFIFFISLGFLVSSCASKTDFYGEAKLEGGPKQCQNICSGWNMNLSGMVAMGEYTNGCICTVKGASNISVNDVGAAIMSTGMSAGAAAGVAGQMKREQENAAASNKSAVAF